MSIGEKPAMSAKKNPVDMKTEVANDRDMHRKTEVAKNIDLPNLHDAAVTKALRISWREIANDKSVSAESAWYRLRVAGNDKCFCISPQWASRVKRTMEEELSNTRTTLWPDFDSGDCFTAAQVRNMALAAVRNDLNWKWCDAGGYCADSLGHALGDRTYMNGRVTALMRRMIAACVQQNI
jgi:hypothetical protein